MDSVLQGLMGRVRRHREMLLLALLASVLSLESFLVNGSIGINLSDEGYLWYGMQALRHGLVPIRDFQAYDPGRYVWTAAWSLIFGQGLVALRAGCVFFQCFGVLSGLLCVRRVSANWGVLIMAAVAFVLWMIPTYKVFEQSIALMAVYVAVLLVEKPSGRRHFLAGVFVGLMAFMGRNHGIYLVCAFGLLIVLSGWSQGFKTVCQRGAACAAGIGVGYLPQLCMFLFVPGYFTAFLALLDRNVTIGSNVGIPIPWPWTRPETYGGLYGWSWWLGGFFYIGLLVFPILVIARTLWRRCVDVQAHAVLVGAACVGLAYSHHAFSRADWVHLGHSAPTLILGLIAAAGMAAGKATRRRLVPLVSAGLLLATLGTTLIYTPVFEELISKTPYSQRVVAGNTVQIPEFFQRTLDAVERVSTQMARPDEAFLFIPNLPGLYAFTGRVSPVKHLYFTRPTPGLDQATIQQMERAHVQWVLLFDYALDGRDDLRFKNTNPEVFRHLQNHFGPVPVEGLPGAMVLLKRLPAGPGQAGPR